MDLVKKKERKPMMSPSEQIEPDFKFTKGWYWNLKRLLDLFISMILLVILLVPLGVIVLLIKLEDGGPGLFKQERIGRGGKRFMIYKFRTMRMDVPHALPAKVLEKSSEYVTRFGGFLRRTSMDELPQILNIIKGDMSWIGPRPMIPNEGVIHDLRHRYGVYAVRPGLTGLAQISGRDEISQEQKALLDAYYVQHYGLAQDLRIVSSTIPQILSGFVSGDNAAAFEKRMTNGDSR